MAKKSNKLIIDLGKISLTAKQRSKLQKALHKTVSKHFLESNFSPVKTAVANVIRAATTKSATLQITFSSTDPGLSTLTAIHNGVRKTVSQSGKITFDNVSSGNSIDIQGRSNGNTTVTIDVDADPMQMNFSPVKIDGVFTIN